MPYRLGSLFDGSGGFPLAGTLCGLEPVWASEVEPYPIAVTRTRFPAMRHLGDISRINGAEVEPVDVITFGSPCQDLSVAGKRAGLKHEANGDEETTRSGLFMEAVRIIKEMREATNGKYPRFALWENVPGAFSSNKGEDFRVVLEELIKIAEPGASVPSVPARGWAYADNYRGDGWSLAYRVFDAQFWGVPQRRRRIHLVLDLGGDSARAVLFERESVRGNITQGRTSWQGAAGGAEDCAGADDRAGEGSGARGGRQLDAVAYTMKERAGCAGGGKGPLVQTNQSATLQTSNDQYLFQPIPGVLLDDQGGQQVNVRTDDKSPTLRAEAHGNVPAVVAKTYAARGNGDGDTVNTITGDHENRITDFSSVVVEPSPVSYLASGKESVGTLLANAGTKLWLGNQEAFSGDYHIIEQTKATRYVVRRLTPTECARLQGFPDDWAHPEEKQAFTEEELTFWQEVRDTFARINGREPQEYTERQLLIWYNKLHTDSAEYKLWGNGIALPPALYCMQGVTDALTTAEETEDWMK